MDILQLELAKLRRDGNLAQSIQDVDKIIEQLERAREAIVTGTKSCFLWPEEHGSLTHGTREENVKDLEQFWVEHLLTRTPFRRSKLPCIHSCKGAKSHEERLR